MPANLVRTVASSRTAMTQAMGSKFASIVNRDAYAEAIVRGDTEAQQSYLRSLVSVYSTLEDAESQAGQYALVTGAYAIHALDNIAGKSVATADANDSLRKAAEDAGREFSNLSASRISNLRRAARLVFEFDLDPETDGPEFRKLAKEARTGPLKEAMDADDATKASLLNALAREFEQGTNGQWKRAETATKAVTRGPGKETGPEKDSPEATSAATLTTLALATAMADAVTRLESGELEIGTAEFRVLESVWGRLEAVLNNPAHAEVARIARKGE